MKPKITFYGGVGKVTGANFLIEWPIDSTDSSGNQKSFRVLVDCGMVQGDSEADADNASPFPYDPSIIDILFVTHAHIDHIGRVPKLVRNGFRGVIYSTAETLAMAPYMFNDAIGIFKNNTSFRHGGPMGTVSQNQHKSNDDTIKQPEPLYSPADAEKALSLWKIINYHTLTDIGHGINVYFRDAGHILGSAMVEFRYMTQQGQSESDTLVERRVVFTGDLGNSPTPLLRDTENLENADYVIMESVYGDRNHEHAEDRLTHLKEILLDNARRGGTLLIPMFSLEKTQVILHEMNMLVEKKEVPQVPVFLDSPLAVHITEIYRRINQNFNDDVKKEIASGDDVFSFPGLRMSMNREDSMIINTTHGPKVIIAGSGMSHGGRIVQHEKHYLNDANNSILFIGYQGSGTLGRMIQEGASQVVIDDEIVPVRARVETITGYSSHKDSDHLVEFISHTASTLKKVFVVMGEDKASLFLVQKLRDQLGVHAFHPHAGDTVILN